MPRVYQKVTVTVTDDHICAAFNELELEVETEVSATPRSFPHDYEPWTEYHDLEVGYPMTINGEDWSEFEVRERVVPAQLKQLEQLLFNAVDNDAWPAGEEGYDPDGY